jgi:hypothetical protein
MSRHSLRPAGELLVSYSAEQMPTPAIAEIQAKTVSDLNAGQIALVDALKIFNLTITLQKLKAAS